MSVKTEKLSKASDSPKTRTDNRGRASNPIVKWVGLLLLAAGVLIACLALYTWLHRYEFAERYVQRFFATQNVDADLTITSLSRQNVTIENITLSYQSDAAPFFSAKSVEADFDMEAALKGQVRKLRFVEPHARITLNEAFEIIDGWVPPRSGNKASGFSIPSEGAFVEDASFEFQTPYGVSDIALTASIYDSDRFEGTLILSPTSLNYEAWSFDGSARIEMDVQGDNKDIDALVQVRQLSGETSNGETISIETADLIAQGRLLFDSRLPIEMDTLDILYQGKLSGHADRIVTPPGVLKTSQFEWSGDIRRMTALSVPLGSKGELSLSTNEFLFFDPQRAKDFARTLTLSEAMSRTPIAQHFVPSVTKAVEFLMQGASFNMKANVDFDEVGGRVELLSPLRVKKEPSTLRITADVTYPLYQWGRSENEMAIAFSAATFNRPVPLTLKDTIIKAETNNGWQLLGVDSFQGMVSTPNVWEEKTYYSPRESKRALNEIARLGPFEAKINYQNKESHRVLFLDGGVDFDGRVPGGYITGLSTQGQVDMKLAPKGQKGGVLSYTPKRRSLALDSFETDTDWRLNTIQFNLDKGQDAFTLRESSSLVNTQLSDLSFLLVSKSDGRSMNMAIERLSLLGRLNPNLKHDDWSVDFEQAELTSDTLPVQGTHLTSPKGQLGVVRASNGIAFDIVSPETNLIFPEMRAAGVEVTVEGTTDSFKVSHAGGVFSSTRIDIPPWPVSGQAVVTGGIVNGDVAAILPKAGNVPVKAVYSFSDGIGQANVTVQDLIFTPGKFQPQNLTSAFAGKIAQVEGRVSADLNLFYEAGLDEAGQALKSNGVLTLSDMNFGTAPGPITGLNTEIQLTSLFPLETAGRQTLTLAKFDPGFPLSNGTLEYDLLPEGITIHSAVWPMGTGEFALDPFTWKYRAEENRVIMRLNEIPINEFLENYGEGKLAMTGTVRGNFPIVVKGLNVFVDNGYLEAPNGGIIRYSPDEGEAITYSQDEAMDILRRQDTPKYRSLARDALREFSYRDLSASINGPLDGDVALGIVFDGANKKVLNGQPFEFDISVEGELFNIARSFNSNAQIKSELIRNKMDAAKE